MTARKAVSGLKGIRNVYAGMRKEYKPCVEALDIATNALKKEAWEEEHPVSPLLYKYPPPRPPKNSDSCIWCDERMMCDKYLEWLRDATDLVVPRVDNCRKYKEEN